VAADILQLSVLVAGTLLLDRLVRPRPGPSVRWRSLAGSWLCAWVALAWSGLFLAVSGHVTVAVAMALAIQALLVLVSNAKLRVLGEPLVFSDLALIGSVFRHPQFYLSAITRRQRLLVAVAALGLGGVLAATFVARVAPHLAGVVLGAGSLAVIGLSLRLRPWRQLAPEPDLIGDVQRHGLVPTLLLYGRRWRSSVDPAPVPPAPPAGDVADGLAPGSCSPELVIVVQCESFADPAALSGDPGLALPGLSAARAAASQWGALQVSGFGAYTMRTEYGVLFGRDEAQLGFRRYDPFLTALGEASYALPSRLAGSGWQSVFVHPHDMRFYGRDRIMPAAGFTELVGEDRFAPPTEGRYVTDAAVADTILELAAERTGPTLIYAVTIENHGPWAPDAADHGAGLLDGYLRLVRNSDRMLSRLSEALAAMRRPALLVFFGDHRPSIPGVVMPGGARHTPYVMMRFDAAGRLLPQPAGNVDLTPAGLHHAILREITGSSGAAAPRSLAAGA